MNRLLKILRWMVALFLVSTIFVVIIYRFLPVYITPLMVIRSVESVSKGESPRWHHTWVSASEMSPEMSLAVMSSEDGRFLSHHGFDLDAIEQAAKYNKTHTRKHGASTITQQTAKNVFLWPGRSWLRKGFEAYFTVLIELLWGKDRIMEVYLNSIEMGPAIYGVEAVAQENFGKFAENLTADECALIAATLPNPLKFSSKDPSAYMRKRQRQIMQEMRIMRKIIKEK